MWNIILNTLPSWVYHINEWYDLNGPFVRRYLFVNKVNGNILEVKTMLDFGPVDLAEWRIIHNAMSNLSEINSDNGTQVYPNPVDEILEIVSQKDIKYIDIFDLQGKQIRQHTFASIQNIQKYNVAFLEKGHYVLKILDANKNIISTSKIIKNNMVINAQYSENGLNIWRPYPSSDYGNYKIFLDETGKVGIGRKPTLTQGAYVYALTVNDIVLATKKMINQ